MQQDIVMVLIKNFVASQGSVWCNINKENQPFTAQKHTSSYYVSSLLTFKNYDGFNTNSLKLVN